MAVIPRGVRFRVELPDGQARGYVAKNFGAMLRLPELGPIGSNGLANPRDFLTPVASFEDAEGQFELVAKFQGKLWSARIDHSPLDVVAWHGNYAPYKYDLRLFNTHRIDQLRSSRSIDLYRSHVAERHAGRGEHGFRDFSAALARRRTHVRPPWFHRNIASEFMGLVHGAYDAKAGGFVPGGASLHNCMSGHGPDAASFEKATHADTTKPDHVTDTMAFMFETRFVCRPTKFALETSQLDHQYFECWQGLRKRF